MQSRYQQQIRKMTPGSLGGQSRVATPVANIIQVSGAMSAPAPTNEPPPEPPGLYLTKIGAVPAGQAMSDPSVYAYYGGVDASSNFNLLEHNGLLYLTMSSFKGIYVFDPNTIVPGIDAGEYVSFVRVHAHRPSRPSSSLSSGVGTDPNGDFLWVWRNEHEPPYDYKPDDTLDYYVGRYTIGYTGGVDESSARGSYLEWASHTPPPVISNPLALDFSPYDGELYGIVRNYSVNPNEVQLVRIHWPITGAYTALGPPFQHSIYNPAHTLTPDGGVWYWDDSTIRRYDIPTGTTATFTRAIGSWQALIPTPSGDVIALRYGNPPPTPKRYHYNGSNILESDAPWRGDFDPTGFYYKRGIITSGGKVMVNHGTAGLSNVVSYLSGY